MPTAPRPRADRPGECPADGPGDVSGGASAPRREPCRVVVDPEGPLLVEGPVEVVLEDGRTVVSDRFLVAVCVCRRSRSYPWCDTSHRRRVRKPSPEGTSERPSERPPQR